MSDVTKATPPEAPAAAPAQPAASQPAVQPPAAPPPPKVARPILVSLGTMAAMTLPALFLAMPSMWGLELDVLPATAAPTLLTAWMMVLGASLGGAARGKRNVVHTCMLGALAALVVVGFPLFIALEPVAWRFAVGLIGPSVVAAAVAYGAPVAARSREPRVGTVVRAWTWEPLRLVVSVVRALLGRDVKTQGGAHG